MIRLSLLIALLFLSSCASKKIKDVPFLTSEELQISVNGEIPTLNVFVPRKKNNQKRPVFIFVHGGNWNSGKKELYGFMGRNFAKHEVITVISGYTLSPNANYDIMARQIAEAVRWTESNIAQYGGDPEQIFLSGHSAGGHLVALLGTNPKYLESKNSIKGIVLNDAAALDMASYLEKYPPTTENNYITTWSTDIANWRDASPIYFVDETTPPMKIYLGSKTYKSIDFYNKKFLPVLQQYQPEVQLEILDKKHIPMVTQFFWPWNKRYHEIVDFMKSN